MSDSNHHSAKRSIPARRLSQSAPATHFSATVDTPIFGFLSVEVLFLGEPVADLAIEFRTDADTPVEGYGGQQTGNPSGLKNRTDKRGHASVPHMVAVGNYTCLIEHQDPAPITTVESISKPFVIVLPVGRSYFDCYDPNRPGVHTREKVAGLRKKAL